MLACICLEICQSRRLYFANIFVRCRPLNTSMFHNSLIRQQALYALYVCGLGLRFCMYPQPLRHKRILIHPRPALSQLSLVLSLRSSELLSVSICTSVLGDSFPLFPYTEFPAKRLREAYRFRQYFARALREKNTISAARCLYAFVYVYVYVYICRYIYTYIYIYTHTHTHAYTHIDVHTYI